MLSGNAVKWVQKTVFLYSPSVQLLLLWLLLTIQSKSSKIVVAAIHSAVKFIGFKNIKLGPIQQCCTKFCLHEGYVIKFFFFFLLSQRCWISFISILEAILQCAWIIVSHQVVFLLFRQSNGNIYRYNVVYIQQCYHYCKKTFESTPLWQNYLNKNWLLTASWR